MFSRLMELERAFLRLFAKKKLFFQSISASKTMVLERHISSLIELENERATVSPIPLVYFKYNIL